MENGSSVQNTQSKSADSMFWGQLPRAGLTFSVGSQKVCVNPKFWAAASRSSFGWTVGRWKLHRTEPPPRLFFPFWSQLGLVGVLIIVFLGSWVERNQLSRQLGSKLEEQVWWMSLWCHTHRMLRLALCPRASLDMALFMRWEIHPHFLSERMMCLGPALRAQWK